MTTTSSVWVPKRASPQVRRDKEDRVPILLVDDRPQDLNALAAMLATPDVDIVTASSSKAALRHMLVRDFAVVLLDVHMPETDGFELATIIKARERTRLVPIVFLTAAATDVRYIYRAYSVGAVDYLGKPIDRDVVRAKVAVFVELYKKDRRIKAQAAALREADRRERDRQIEELRAHSEARYRNLAEAIPQIVWTADRDGAVTYYNQRFTDFTGLDRHPPPSWIEAVHVDDKEQVSRMWTHAVESGRAFEAECRVRDASGRYRWHLARAVPEGDESGEIVGWLGTHTDCDDLKRTHAEAEKARARATFLAEASAALASSLELSSTLARVTRLPISHVGDWCAVDLEPAAGTGARAIAVAHAAPERERELSALAESGAMRGATDDGLCLLTGATAVLRLPLIVRERQLGTMTFGSDTRTLSASDREIAGGLAHHASLAVDNARLYLALREALGARDEFLSIAAHELRTPLTALQLQMQLLARSLAHGTVEKAATAVASSVRQVERLSRLTERLLDVSRIAAGHLRLELEDFELAETVRDIVERFAAEADDAGCDLRLDVEGTTLGRWDRLRVEQLVNNLLSNALKYGRGNPVELSVAQHGADVRLIVRDHGLGIDEQDLQRIFECFERAAPRRQYGGLGIGLFVARQIVEAHGGTIRVESTPGVGSAFVVTLPRAVAISKCEGDVS